MKFDSSDILAILRRFGQATDADMPRAVSGITKQQPHNKSVLIQFNFQRRAYCIVIDNTAEDDADDIYQQVASSGTNQNYRLIPNPLDELITYGLPYKGKDCYLLVATAMSQRLDQALVQRYGAQSRSAYQKLIAQGLVRVNGQQATSAKQQVRPSDNLVVDEPQPLPPQLPYTVLYEDDDVLVIDKPAGMLTHAKNTVTREFSAADIIRPHTTYQCDTPRPGIIHRLDRATSGVLVMAKNPAAAQMLQQQFSQRTVIKTYLAVVDGVPSPAAAIVDLPIERNPKSPSTFRVGAGGKPAYTTYRTRYTTADGHHSLVELRPKTGRTHQLRVQMQYCKTPIMGDIVYGGSPAERMMLHAASIELTLPNGQRRQYNAPLPAAFSPYTQPTTPHQRVA